MPKAMRRIRCAARLFLLGGAAYVLLEKLWRGRSHWTMFLLGGVCFHQIGMVATLCRSWRYWQKCTLCAALITVSELLCGCLVNLRLRMNVWDYSRCPLQFKGQICLPYSLLWGFLSAAVMPIYTLCRKVFYGR